MERVRWNMNRIGKILPIEGYWVELQGTLPMDYAKSLTHLYQPLIGMAAIILYQTLLHEQEIQAEKQIPQTHHTLMNYLNLPLDEIYAARLRLEGIGLLKTYEINSQENRVYTYVLMPVFSPAQFFKDPMLSQLLYHHIGIEKYDVLEKHYSSNSSDTYGKNITASFQDVFQTVTPDSLPKMNQEQPKQGVNMESVDFTPIEQSLKQRMIPVKKVLTTYNCKMITQMMFLYELETYEIEKAILWALTEENRLHVDEFKAACYDLFQSKYKENHIRLVEKATTTEPQKKNQLTANTKEEQLINHLETISPKQLLEDLSSGHHASEQDLRLVGDIMTSQGLPAPVMNVLIHYVLLQTNMKLSKNYLAKIASHWSRANLKTAKEAMAFAKKEVTSYKTAKKPVARNRQTKEVVPEWFKQQKKQQKQEVAATQEDKEDELQEQKEIEMLLKQYSNHNK
ncbi:replicative DNA helicase loader DnaB [Virgibacillus pantothenticus]|nr:replicative DNA helicase loader DnaB [Virgibacillus pantothenticus]